MPIETKTEMIQPAALSEYQELLAGISKIFEDAKDSTLISVNKIRNHAFWLIGERIVRVEQSGQIRAVYGSRLIPNISRDLGFKYKNGFSESNLRAMRKFYLSHPIQHPGAELSWSHHKLLLGIKDTKKRQYFEKITLEKGWSKRDLRKALIDNEIDIEEAVANPVSRKKSEKIKKIPFKRGRLFNYQLVDLNLKPQGNLLVVDCGFKILRRVLTDKIYLFSKGEIIESVKEKEEWKIQKALAGKDHLYTYKAYLQRVVDGDTLVVQVDCGFDTWTEQRLRLKGLDCPPLTTQKGQKAMNFVEKALEEVDFIVIRSSKSDKYDRYLADIFYLPGEEDPAVVAGRGRFLNQELLDKKLAVTMSG